MIYTVSRTSLWNNEKPCEEAVERPFENWDIRKWSEERYDCEFGERQGVWKSKGRNHRITEEGYIARQLDDVIYWSVEINSLEELEIFIKKYDKAVIQKGGQIRNILDIEIYDDYRE
jgi:hypothetical protein